MNFLKSAFWIETLDRAIKSFAQGCLLAIGASDVGPVDAFALDWPTMLGFGLGMVVLSVLMSLASGQVGTQGNASALPLPVSPPE